MLQQFLWFVPLEFGAYFTGLTAALASFASMLHEWSFLQTTGMNQGNFGFLLLYFASSLLLLNGVRLVSKSLLNFVLCVMRMLSSNLPKVFKNFECSGVFEVNSSNLKGILEKKSIQGTAASEFHGVYLIMNFHNFWRK